MSSTVTLERPARHGFARPARGVPRPPLALYLSILSLISPGSEAALAPASSSSPALADLLFDDIDIPSTVPADGTEAPAAAPFTITDISTAYWAAAKVLAAQARIAERAELASSYKSHIDAWLSDSCNATTRTLPPTCLCF